MFRKLSIITIFCLLFFFIFGCSKKREIVPTEVIAPLDIESVAKDTDKDITQGNELLLSGDYAAAINAYTNSTSQNKATAFYNIGVAYYILKNTEKAEENFRQAVEADPNFDEAIINLVAVLSEQGVDKAREAEKYITHYINTSKTGKVFTNIANVYLNSGDTAKAMYYYRKSLEVDAENPSTLENYANCLISIGEYQDGIDILERLNDRNFVIYYNLANAYLRLGNRDIAYSNAKEAMVSDGATEAGYNRLAIIFNRLKKYSDEVQVLRILIAGSPSRDYKERLIRAYLCLSQNTKALDEVNALISEYPDDENLAILKYHVLVFTNLNDANAYIRAIYAKFKSDKVLSFLSKHICYFAKNQNELPRLLNNNRTNGWISLARAAYALKRGSFQEAANYLALANDTYGHDYFAYNAFLNIKNKDYNKALQFAEQMDLLQYDTFWYRLVILWNLRDSKGILELSDQYKDSTLVNIRPPALQYDLRPVLSDMSFTYRFDEKGIDVASMLAYPIFIKPDEAAQFLLTGSGVLKDSERNEIMAKLEGIKKNNSAIEAFSSFDFDRALALFNEAHKALPHNSQVSYNLALTLFNLGDNLQAMKVVDDIIRLDAKDPYINFVAALINYRLGNLPESKTNLDTTKLRLSKKLADLAVFNQTPEDGDVRVLYLSIMASDRVNRKQEAETIYQNAENGMLVTYSAFMDYFDDFDIKKLDKLTNSPLFRVERVRKLLALRHVEPAMYEATEDADKYYTLAYNFAMLSRGYPDKIKFQNRYARDKVYLKDMVYASMFMNDKRSGYTYLQTISQLDFRFNDLYKVSLYYFTWVRDFVNGEASYGSLERLNYMDQTSIFSMLLYFLANFNEARLQKYIKFYEENYGADYKTDVATALLNLYIKNMSNFDSIVRRLLVTDPYIFDKMFIEVDFAAF